MAAGKGTERAEKGKKVGMNMISELVEGLRNKSSCSMFPQEFRGLLEQAADTIEALSEKCRNIDAEPVRHEYWIEEKSIANAKSYRCSGCGHTEDYHITTRGRYCWFCGAKMDGESEVQKKDATNGE